MSNNTEKIIKNNMDLAINYRFLMQYEPYTLQLLLMGT